MSARQHESDRGKLSVPYVYEFAVLEKIEFRSDYDRKPLSETFPTAGQAIIIYCRLTMSLLRFD